MKYAIVNGERQEAKSGSMGVCPVCNSVVVAKCGDIRIHHWAHRRKSNCDPWWENETEWHRNWKNNFPDDWQEVVLYSENGEKHIADVKTDQGWVLEFQHSKIQPDERKAREVFYKKMVWIVDGTRRKRDRFQFFNKWEEGRDFIKQIGLREIFFPEECALLRDWSNSGAPVLFDFSRDNNQKDPYLWFLIRVEEERAYIGPFSRKAFIEYHNPDAKKNNLDFSEKLKIINEIIDEANQYRKANLSGPVLLQPRRWTQRRRRRL